MNGKVRVAITACLLAAGGCFRDVSSLNSAPPQPSIAELVVRDGLGAAWPTRGTPRAPELTVRLDGAVSPARTPLFLVRGEPDDLLLEDLADPPLRQETEHQLIAVELDLSDAADGLLRVRPVAALAAGERYALIWAAPPEPELIQLEVSRSPSAGASLAEAWPAAEQRNVPPNLSRALLRFDGFLGSAPNLRVLETGPDREQPIQVTMQRCGELGLPEGHCVWVVPEAPLAPNARYELAIDGPLQDASGAKLTLESVFFETAAAPDERAPSLSQALCALDELSERGACLLLGEDRLDLRATADEPVFVELLAPPVGAAALAFSEPFALALAGLSPEGCAFLRLTDLAGHRSEEAACYRLPDDLATLTIDEVRADPLGAEPAQEYVELLNFGAHPVDMTGFWLSDDAYAQGLPIDAPQRVEPGQRVLLVGPEFDRSAMQDGALPAALTVVRLGRSLSLANQGARLFLRDAAGRRVASSPALAPGREGQCIGRVGSDLRSGALEDFARDPGGACTPGSPTREAAWQP
jgi:hypothetical protein